jgi:general nucleoside transport system permease protein
VSAWPRTALPLALCALEAGAVAAAMLLFALFLLAVGAEPLPVFADMYAGALGSRFSIENTLARAAPLLLTALCTALPARLGMVVIGNEGALLLGGLAAAGSAMALPHELGRDVLLPAMLIAGGSAGGLWIALCGVLRQRRGVNETISSLLLFYVGLGLFLYLVEGPMRDPSSLNKPSTYPIGDAHMLGNLPGMDVHYGLVFGLLACLLAYVLMEHTTFGFSARVAGGNLRAARVAGLKVTRLVLVTCLLGGAAAGLAGAVEVVAIHGTANATLYAGLGFTGILVAFVARHHPLAIIPVAILMGGIEASGGVLQRRHDLPDAAVDVFKGILFLVILASEAYVAKIEAAVQRWTARSAEPLTSALGDAEQTAQPPNERSAAEPTVLPSLPSENH